MKLEQRGNLLLLHVKVVPNASRSALAGLLGDELKLKVAAPPEDGKANRAVEELLAKILGLARSDVTVVGGLTKPRKVVELSRISLEDAQSKITHELGDAA